MDVNVPGFRFVWFVYVFITGLFTERFYYKLGLRQKLTTYTDMFREVHPRDLSKEATCFSIIVKHNKKRSPEIDNFNNMPKF